MDRETGRRTTHLIWAVVGWIIVLGSLAVALALTVPRFLDPTTNREIQLVAMTPFGLVPALLVFLVALVLAIRARGGWRVLPALFAVVGLVGSVLHVVWLAPLYVGSAPPPAPGAPLVVLTQNLEYGNADGLAAEVRARGVEVLVVCDLGPEQREAVRASSIPRDLPYLADIGGGTIVHSRYPVTEAIRFVAGSRSLQVRTPQLGTIALLAVHPTPPHQGPAWSADYARMRDFLVHRPPNDAALPTVIAGDFNATLDHRPLRRILDLGFTDGVVQTNGGFRPTWPIGISAQRFGVSFPPLVQIDHVLVSGQLVVTETENVEVAGADHLGIVASVRRAATADDP